MVLTFLHFATGTGKPNFHRRLARQLDTYLFIMAALRNRAGHYIFALWFLYSIFFFFHHLISVVGDWMSTILPHMMWP